MARYYDRSRVDDELARCWSVLPAGARILLVSPRVTGCPNAEAPASVEHWNLDAALRVLPAIAMTRT